MIGEMARSLNAFTPEKWALYAFAQEPLAGRFSQKEKLAFFREASACGITLAKALRSRYANESIAQIAGMEGAKLIRDRKATDDVSAVFATFTEPDEIRVFVDDAQRTDALIREHALSDITGGVKTEDVLLAHELYHYVESKDSSLYTAQKHALLFRVGRWENRSRIRCLAEIGAMAFAQTLAAMACSAYVFDVLMLYAGNPQRALQAYQGIRRVCGEEVA